MRVITPNVIIMAETARPPWTTEATLSWGPEKSLHKIRAQAMGVRNGHKIQNERNARRAMNNKERRREECEVMYHACRE